MSPGCGPRHSAGGVKGQWDLPGGGQWFCPLVAIRTARWRPVVLPWGYWARGINTLQRNHEAHFGGFKQSGVVLDGGSDGLLAYSELQSIVWST